MTGPSRSSDAINIIIDWCVIKDLIEIQLPSNIIREIKFPKNFVKSLYLLFSIYFRENQHFFRQINVST